MNWMDERDQVEEITFPFLLMWKVGPIMWKVGRLSSLAQLPDQCFDCSGSATKAGQVTVLHKHLIASLQRYSENKVG